MWFLLAAALLMGPGIARSEDRFSIGPTAGTTAGGVTEQHEAVYGGQLTVQLDEAVSIELAVLRLTDHPTEERLDITVTGSLEITPVQLSARYSRRLIGEWLKVFLAAGVGYYFCEDADFEIEGIEPGGPVVVTGPTRVDKKDAVGWQVSGGLEWMLSGSLTALLEYRFAAMKNYAFISGLSATSPDGADAIAAFEKDFRDNNELGILRVGLNWQF
jgi:opacity protein-like surface antigen